MSIKEIMEFGTSGMNTAQRMEEQERRLKVSERLNTLQIRLSGCETAEKDCDKCSDASKMLKGKIRQYKREMNRIKADESIWLKQAAWFLYC